ncbi:hypothetical protein FOA52_004236 [Chlamydomonas sp. UWO 241]|nr:hypothetical protein FOA52_004236 [Chlamydomonas sp. UWO 241]
MWFSRAALIVYKTTGGKRWIPKSGLPALSPTQARNRKRNAETTLKNLSVLKMAATHEPTEPTRLYKPLNHWRLMWMRTRMEASRSMLGWEGAHSNRALEAKLKSVSVALAEVQQQQQQAAAAAAGSQMAR